MIIVHRNSKILTKNGWATVSKLVDDEGVEIWDGEKWKECTISITNQDMVRMRLKKDGDVKNVLVDSSQAQVPGYEMGGYTGPNGNVHDNWKVDRSSIGGYMETCSIAGVSGVVCDGILLM